MYIHIVVISNDDSNHIHNHIVLRSRLASADGRSLHGAQTVAPAARGAAADPRLPGRSHGGPERAPRAAHRGQDTLYENHEGDFVTKANASQARLWGDSE